MRFGQMLEKLGIEGCLDVQLPNRSINGSEPPTAPLVVIVDDHEDSLVLATHVLEGINCRCVPTKNAEECFDILRQIQPDIILLDILLPDISGFEALKRIRQRFNLPEIPVIAMTAQSSLEDRTKMVAEGFTDYLIKPFRLKTLVETIQYYLKPYSYPN